MNALRIAAASDASFEQNDLPTPRVAPRVRTDSELDEEIGWARENLNHLENAIRSKAEGPTRTREMKVVREADRERLRCMEEMRAVPIHERASQPWLPVWAERLAMMERTYENEKASVKALRESGRKSVPTLELESLRRVVKELRHAVHGLTEAEKKSRMLHLMND